MSNKITALAAFITTALLSSMPNSSNAAEFNLPAIHQQIEKDYGDVRHINRTQLDMLRQETPEDLILFDVREPDEFAVSHIKGAHRLSPGSWKTSVLEDWGQKVDGKTVIFYCSVGVRSSKMAAYLADALKQSGAKDIYNLKEGVFGWANQSKPLINNQGATPYVHPYNDHWGKLLKSKQLWRKTP